MAVSRVLSEKLRRIDWILVAKEERHGALVELEIHDVR